MLPGPQVPLINTILSYAYVCAAVEISHQAAK